METKNFNRIPSIIKIILIVFVVFVICMLAVVYKSQAQTQPLNYWTCDSTNNPSEIRDMKNNFNLRLLNQTYAIKTGGQVQKYLELGKTSALLTGSSGTVAITGSFSIEFLWRPGRDFGSTQFFNIGSKANAKLSLTQSAEGTPSIQFVVAGNNLKVLLDRDARGNIGYYLNKFTHFVFTYNNATGLMKIYIDGHSPTGYSQTIAASSWPSGNAQLTFNSNTSYRKCLGDLDEIAVYTSAISANQVLSNFNDITLGNHYQFNGSTTPFNEYIDGALDTMDYAPGSVLLDTGHTTGAYQSAIDQLKSYPLPRYKPGNGLMKNFNFVDMFYMSGYKQSGYSDTAVAAMAARINLELALRWNYLFMLNQNLASGLNLYTDTTKLVGKMVKIANANPSLQTGAFVFQAQLNPTQAGFSSNVGYIESQTLPDEYYLQNSSGQFLNINGTVSGGTKRLSPACPTDSLKLDGLTARFYLKKLLDQLTRPLNYLGENDEVIPLVTATAMNLDPAVTTARLASGFTHDDFRAAWKTKLMRIYRDSLLAGHPEIYFGCYQIGGYDKIFPGWGGNGQLRTILSPRKGSYQSQLDLYIRGPEDWRIVAGPDRGVQALIDAKKVELSAGDPLTAYWVSAGWSRNEPSNMRPAQYLGMLKCYAVTGCEYYHVGFFNDQSSYEPPNPPPPFPQNYTWQMAMPSYAQAITSKVEDILFNGTLMDGDVPASVDPPQAGPGYMFNTGDPRIWCVARKHNGSYWIAATLNRYGNKVADSPIQDTNPVTVYIDGDTLRFFVRQQGSVYLYTKGSDTTFIQLDGWHEPSHPSRWSKAASIEMELADSVISGVQIRTDRNGLPKGNYLNATSYARFTAPGKGANYNVPLREKRSYYLYIYCRKPSGRAEIVAGVGGKNYHSGIISSKNWKWYKIPLGVIDPATVSMINIKSRLSGVDVDRMEISANQSLYTTN